MPSGKKIDWTKYDDLIRKELPKYTIVDFRKKFLPDISAKAIGSRAKKLGIKSARYLTEAHKERIASSLFKESPELLVQISQLRDHLPLRKAAKEAGIGYATLCRVIKRHGIKLSEKGKQRALQASKEAGIGKVPWSKGKKMSKEFRKKVSKGVSGPKNGQYGRGMTEEEKKRWRKSYRATGIHKLRQWLKSQAGQEAARKSLVTTTSKEFKEQASKRISEMIKNGTFDPTTKGKPTRMQTKKGGNFTTKSSYETRYARMLEADKDVVKFIYEPCAIPYEFEGVTLYYIPDFLVEYVNDKMVLVEVKPRKLLSLPKNQAKIAAGVQCRLDFKVVTEDDLK